MKNKLFSLTASDFIWSYYNGTGKGGSNRNKNANCVRCSHAASKAVGKSEEERSLLQNKKTAFKRMTETKEFQAWLKSEICKRSGEYEKVRLKVEKELVEETVVYIQNDDDKWIQSQDLNITYQDIKNIRNDNE